ncbi:MAG: hypothetical protein DHS20C16_06900 [Phycisphaerae bacterium]|nr:MAG: hypothetical protein DHS20C16_06900 [Phycisphaerae bacterium]
MCFAKSAILVIALSSQSLAGVASFQGFGDLPGGSNFSEAKGLSPDGSVVVGRAASASGSEAFRWTAEGGMVGLGDLPGGSFFSGAADISADGSVISGTGRSASGVEAFRWTAEGGMVGLGDLPGGSFRSIATDASADGSVVVGHANSETGHEAFIWDQFNGMRSVHDLLVNELSIDLTGWSFIGATDVSADGMTIVGSGINPDGFIEAWIATIPEPSSLILLAASGVAVAQRRRSKRQAA